MDFSILKNDFIEVASIAGISINEDDIEIQMLPSGPTHLTKPLPKNFMAVYIFLKDETCYKVGKVGANSNARYQTQHYLPNSSKSNLAKSLLADETLKFELEVSRDISLWTRNTMTRVNILIPCSYSVFVLNCNS